MKIWKHFQHDQLNVIHFFCVKLATDRLVTPESILSYIKFY